MRLRTSISGATAAALIAAVLAVPAQAMADTPSPSPSATTGPGAVTVAAPTVDAITSVDTDHGIVLRVTAHGDADISTVEVTATPFYSGAGTTFSTFTLTTGQANNGVWETTAPLGLRYGQYSLSADVVDSQGNHSSALQATQALDYDKLPAYHDIAFGTTQLSYGNELVTATGRVTSYDPGTGDNGTPFVNSSAQIFLSGYMANGYTYLTAADGTFKVTAAPGPNFTDKTFTLLGIDQYSGHTTLGATQVSSAAPAPTRIVLDSASGGGYKAGSAVKLSGVAQYEDDQQVWHPLVGSTIEFGQPSYSSTVATTDATGRFSLEASAPTAATTWNVYLAQDGRADAFLQPASAAFQITSVQQVVTPRLDSPSVDQFSKLTFYMSISSTDGRVGGGRVYVLESPNGANSWKNLGYINVTQSVSWLSISFYVDNPHGYWMLYYPGATGYAPAYGNVIHTYRGSTLITGGKPNRTSAYRGQTLTWTGTLWAKGTTGGWTRVHGGYQMALVFRPYGSRTWYLATSTRTDAYGNFTVRFRTPRSGTWAVVYLDTGGKLVDATGPMVYVSVH